MTNDGKKDSKLDDMSEEIAAIRRLHSECPHILDWKDTTGFTIPILNVAVALADYALDCEARCEASVRQWQYVLELANAKAVGMLYSDTFSPSRIAEIAHKALASHQATSNPIVSQNNQETSDKEARCEALEAALENEDISKCEGCEAPAVTADSEGVPLCQACYDDLKRTIPPALDKEARCEASGQALQSSDEYWSKDARIVELEETLEAIAKPFKSTWNLVVVAEELANRINIARAALAPRSAEDKGK